VPGVPVEGGLVSLRTLTLRPGNTLDSPILPSLPDRMSTSERKLDEALAV
jgi:hypothetical protein